MKKVYVVVLILLFLTALAANVFAQSVASLPVVLVDINAVSAEGNQVNISWTARQQINTDCFTVQKSCDGISWQSIAVVNATGSSANPVTYQLLDRFPLKGSNFYRVMMKNINGEFGYTVTKNVRIAQQCRTVVYPNPSSAIVTVSLGGMPDADWHLLLINSVGKVMLRRKYSSNSTSVNLRVDGYANGNYTLQVCSAGSVQNKTLMINHN